MKLVTSMVSAVEILYHQLFEKIDSLKVSDNELLSVIDAKDIEKEVEQSEAYMENLISYKCKITQKIASLTPPVVPPTFVNHTNVPSSTIDTVIQEPRSSIKLPKLTVNKFYGDHKNWLEFLSQFENAIDKNSGLSKIEKLIYLKSLVGGVAAKAISDFALTENNYDAALELLKIHFGQKNLFINAHLGSLLSITPIKNTSDTNSLRKLYDRTENEIRNLESLGINSESCGKEIQSRERALSFHSFVKEKQIPNSSNQQCSSFVFGSRSYNKSAYGKQRGNNSSAAELLVNLSTANNKCIFCGENLHDSSSFDSVSIEMKSDHLKRNKLCFFCFSGQHSIAFCPKLKKEKGCSFCGLKSHSKTLCYRFHENNSDKTTSNSRKEESDDSVASVSSCQTETKTQRVLLQTASVVARYNKQFRNCRLLADTGAQRNFVERKFSRLLKVPVIRKDKLSVYSFGDTSPVEKTFNVVKISKHLKGLKLADTTNSDANISVLIGADNYYDVMTGRIKRISRKLVAAESLYGWCLIGISAPPPNKNSSDSFAMKVVVEEDISKQLEAFWQLENLGIEPVNENLNCPNLYPDLFELLLSFRKHPITFTVDIKQEFLNVELDDSDKNVTKFFWTDNPESFSESLEVSRFNRVLFGINSSSLLLTATIKYHLKKYSSLFPQTHELLNKFVYVDDVLGGQSTVASACTTRVKCVQIFSEANMLLHKWATNSAELRELWEKNGFSIETSSNSVGQNMISYKVIRISWDTDRDVFYFDVENLLSFISKRTDTKRFLLQVADRIFDRLGLIAPYVIRLKVLIQNVWEMGLFWDQEMPQIVKKPFKEWCHELKDLHLVSIPRFYDFSDSNKRGAVDTEELKKSEEYWIKEIQKETYGSEIIDLEKTQKVSDCSKIRSLVPYLDDRQILRIKGRLDESELSLDEKQPILLPQNSKFTEMLILREHTKNFHSGVTTTLVILRRKFWIPKGRQLVKKIIKKCLICRKYSLKPANQITA
ncbi:integrase catalytic domain-containing protein [Nephila pilipes]|uniref:Integrase catalytic domain-containing protein n=1 Tax=Nephila pilipes TaxID=299642 RepID=A0A8X6PSP1_NEPPI|nr:integrase catalytic domain-containing protein [Nephila pilipes]